jgi:hypothetical protein
MAQIPAIINGVAVEFGPDVSNDVEQRLVDALVHCVKPGIASPHALSRIYISSAADQHAAPSRHVQKKAVDISRINGVKIAVAYPGDTKVKAIVDAIQDRFETFAHRRENFGPHLKKKLGHVHAVAGHNDHIHLSVN